MPQHAHDRQHDMTIAFDAMNRREALRRTALLLGGAVSAPTIAALLAGCDARSGDKNWSPRALNGDQAELVATIAEHIIPETDTPGARGTGVHRFIDTMLAEYYTPGDRDRFLAGLDDVDARAQRSGGKSFLRLSPKEQVALLGELDRDAYAEPATPFFRTMKELTILGYYTSEPGATLELHHVRVPGRFGGCVPLAQVGRTWAV